MRTKSTRALRWLMRVGLRKVLKDCRLTFFSSAPRMRVHGSIMVVLVGTKDIRFLQLARCAPIWMMADERKEATARLPATGDAAGAGWPAVETQNTDTTMPRDPFCAT